MHTATDRCVLGKALDEASPSSCLSTRIFTILRQSRWHCVAFAVCTPQVRKLKIGRGPREQNPHPDFCCFLRSGAPFFFVCFFAIAIIYRCKRPAPELRVVRAGRQGAMAGEPTCPTDKLFWQVCAVPNDNVT